MIKKKYFIFLLIYLTLLSSYLTVYSLAKYTFQKNMAGAKGVAKFDVAYEAVDNPTKINMIGDNSSNNFVFTVKSKSETAVKYDVKVSNIPDGIKVAIDNRALTTPTNGTVLFENVGTFPVSASSYATREHTLVLSAIREINDLSEADIDLDVTFTQINVH